MILEGDEMGKSITYMFREISVTQKIILYDCLGVLVKTTLC